MVKICLIFLTLWALEHFKLQVVKFLTQKEVNLKLNSFCWNILVVHGIEINKLITFNKITFLILLLLFY